MNLKLQGPKAYKFHVEPLLANVELHCTKLPPPPWGGVFLAMRVERDLTGAVDGIHSTGMVEEGVAPRTGG